jgi:DNA-binding CsgD family transcriptional regulator
MDREDKVITERQIEVIRLLSIGKTWKEVSLYLGISKDTVYHHLESARQRLNVVSTPQLVAESIRRGLIS